MVGRRMWTSKELARVEEMRVAGHTIPEIARELGRTTDSIGACARTLGVGRGQAKWVQKWLAAIRKGGSRREIAARVGCSPNAVSVARRKLFNMGFDV